MRTRQFVSVDKVTITAFVHQTDYDKWFAKHQSVLKKKQNPSWRYKETWGCPDGSRVSKTRDDISSHDIRIAFNPNKELLWNLQNDIVPELFLHLFNVELIRTDIAVDYLGFFLPEWELLHPYLGKEVRSTGFGAMQSVTLGSSSSRLQIYAYNKGEYSKDKNTRILYVSGGHVAPQGELWMRIEVRLNKGYVLKPDALSKLMMFKRESFQRPQGMREERADMLEAISHNYPNIDHYLRDMSKNTRERWRNDLIANVTHIDPHPQDLYEDRYSLIRDRIATALAPVGQNMTADTKRILNISKDYPHDLFY